MSYTKGQVYLDVDWFNDREKKVAQLPHSCDEWVIGDVKEIDDLISDLRKLKEELKSEPR